MESPLHPPEKYVCIYVLAHTTEIMADTNGIHLIVAPQCHQDYGSLDSWIFMPLNNISLNGFNKMSLSQTWHCLVHTMCQSSGCYSTRTAEETPETEPKGAWKALLLLRGLTSDSHLQILIEQIIAFSHKRSNE